MSSSIHTDWQAGSLEWCPVCLNDELEIHQMFEFFNPNRSAWLYRCTRCEQKIDYREGLSSKGMSWVVEWRLCEPISEILAQDTGDVGRGADVLAIDLTSVNEELVSYLGKHPELLHEMHPRKFEELVAELLRRMGYEVELTDYVKDGGWDISAVWKNEVGRFLTLVQCKRYQPERPVGIEHVRCLIGVRDIEAASHAMIATTSSFTQGARELQRRFRWQLDLRDYADLRRWLDKYAGMQSPIGRL